MYVLFAKCRCVEVCNLEAKIPVLVNKVTEFPVTSDVE